jgi:hypothetical protein
MPSAADTVTPVNVIFPFGVQAIEFDGSQLAVGLGRPDGHDVVQRIVVGHHDSFAPHVLTEFVGSPLSRNVQRMENCTCVQVDHLNRS